MANGNRLETKTMTIIDRLDHDDYQRKPLDEILDLSALETRALVMGRYGMLNCKANFSMGNGGNLCRECNVVDNESHRINNCVLYRDLNLFDSDERLDFDLIYSDGEGMRNMLKVILSMWDLEHGKNAMRTV